MLLILIWFRLSSFPMIFVFTTYLLFINNKLDVKNGEKYRPVSMESCEVDAPRLLGSTCHPEELTVSQQEEVHTNYRKVSLLLFNIVGHAAIF